MKHFAVQCKAALFLVFAQQLLPVFLQVVLQDPG